MYSGADVDKRQRLIAFLLLYLAILDAFRAQAQV